MTPRCSYSRHCGEEVIGTGPDNLPYCFDHLNEAKAEAERERERQAIDHWPDPRGNVEPLTRKQHRQKHLDEHGRNRAVMRRARAL